MRFVRPVFAGSLVLSVAFGALAGPAAADPTPAQAGVTWLLAQQEADGGFELADFPPFETPDATLAIAAAAQTTSSWSFSEALAAVEAADNGTAGATPLDFLDEFAESVNLTPGTAAKLIILSALPFEFDPEAFDPAGDGNPVDLTATLDDIAPGLFNSFLVGRLAESGLGETVHQRDLQVICEAEKTTGGGWSFDGAPAGMSSADLDTTGFAVMALRSAGVPATDPVLTAAEAFVDGGQQANGSWQSFGSDDANSTVLAMWAWLALDNTLAELDHDPVAFLVSKQLSAPPADAGRIQSPNDTFGVNTFATSQGIQGLLLAATETGADWLPLDGGSGRRCLPESSYTDVTPTSWFDDGARWVDDEDIVGGIGGELRPGGNVNRAQAAQWLNLMFGAPGGDPNTFADVPDGAWYEDGVNFVGDAPNGVIATGFGNQFRPRLNLNRAQAASWLYAAAGSPDTADLPDETFTDIGPSTWFVDAATWAQAHGIVSGFEDGSFRAQRNVTRAQMAQWMFNLAADIAAFDSGVALLPPTALFPLP